MRIFFLWILFTGKLYTQTIGFDVATYHGHYGGRFSIENQYKKLHFKHGLGLFNAPEFKGVSLVFTEDVAFVLPLKSIADVKMGVRVSPARILSTSLASQNLKQYGLETMAIIGIEKQLNPQVKVAVGGLWKVTGRMTKKLVGDFSNWNYDNLGGEISLKIRPKSHKFSATLGSQFWQKGRLKQEAYLGISVPLR